MMRCFGREPALVTTIDRTAAPMAAHRLEASARGVVQQIWNDWYLDHPGKMRKLLPDTTDAAHAMVAGEHVVCGTTSELILYGALWLLTEEHGLCENGS